MAANPKLNFINCSTRLFEVPQALVPRLWRGKCLALKCLAVNCMSPNIPNWSTLDLHVLLQNEMTEITSRKRSEEHS